MLNPVLLAYKSFIISKMNFVVNKDISNRSVLVISFN
jgi:hypothetical protein